MFSLLTFFFILIFLLGLGVGSFVNVLVDRHGRDEGFLGRSYCENCQKILRFYELIPVMSFLLSRGRCRTCRARLSFQYPAVELFTGFSFLFVSSVLLANFPGTIREALLSFLFLIKLVFSGVLTALLLAILVYDLKYKIIPNAWVYLFSGLALVGVLVDFFFFGYGPLGWSAFWWHIAAGPILAIPFALLWFFSDGRLMGFGDAKLALGIGFLLGISSGFAAVVVGFWVGAFVGLFMMFFQVLCGKLFWREKENKLTMKSELPLAPFLLFGVAVVFAGSFHFYHLATLFSFVAF